MAPRILTFSIIAMGAEYSSSVKSTATFALTFFGHNISVLASVNSFTILFNLMLSILSNFEFHHPDLKTFLLISKGFLLNLKELLLNLKEFLLSSKTFFLSLKEFLLSSKTFFLSLKKFLLNSREFLLN